MFQIDQATAVSSLPAPSSAGTPGYFANGNPVAGQPATVVDCDFMNMVMMELVNVVTASGQTLSKTTYNQLLLAIKRLVQSQALLTDAGVANAYAAANNPPLVSGANATWVNGVAQLVVVAHTNTGASTYAPDGLAAIPIYGSGLQPLQGGEMIAGGTAFLMKQTIAGVNSGNPIAVLLGCSGGAQQIPPATASEHAVQFGQVSGVVGSMRNAKMSVAAASATATWTADEIVVETALGGLRYCLANANDTINLAAANGIGAMDTGAAPTNGFVALYKMYNPTTGATGLIGWNATLSAAPAVYGGAHAPTGYTASALVVVWPTNSSGQFIVGYQSDRELWFANTLVLSTGNATVYTAIPLSGVVPANAKTIEGLIYSFGSNASVGYIAGSSSGIGEKQVGGYTGSTEPPIAPFSNIPLITAQTAYYKQSGATGISIYLTGYTI